MTSWNSTIPPFFGLWSSPYLPRGEDLRAVSKAQGLPSRDGAGHRGAPKPWWSHSRNGDLTITISMVCFKGKFTGKHNNVSYCLMGKSRVSGEDVPLKQSIDFRLMKCFNQKVGKSSLSTITGYSNNRNFDDVDSRRFSRVSNCSALWILCINPCFNRIW